ncbi:MAG: sigma-70 family RNA polymerase sigma factor [Candidatus Omnitrophica bacterium]|nr:sigma-70 family RNA polymerase sigma factor [Candidatus Omnitrophota bacterium]MDD5671244.1 sigma-70 family RNA polymerase sigma factor [Candidatus Omnitrophota bacterium]
MIDPDHAYVIKAQAGDKKAFGQLVNHHYEMVYAVAYGILHHHERARDVTQDVFLKVFRDIGQFQGKSKFKTWLYRVTANAALDEARKKNPSQSLDQDESDEDDGPPPLQIADRKAGPRDQAARHELRDLLERAIRKLSPEHRAVLVLREWQELSYEEIAEALGIELGTVMSRIHYARKELGKILENYDDLLLNI